MLLTVSVQNARECQHLDRERLTFWLFVVYKCACVYGPTDCWGFVVGGEAKWKEGRQEAIESLPLESRDFRLDPQNGNAMLHVGLASLLV